ncbi:MAG: 4Fe-4S dicluster domain-containing protein [Bacteroidales bacterium]|jgi:heterodisulfide reductase subunit C|nr:4Fe-4S dicluster domain-containing protein [Bacteroidales bacterium]
MGRLIDRLNQDIRFEEGMKACMNCGVCTAICPAAEFYKYDPREICNLVQLDDEDTLEELLKSDTIWYCGECMSCKMRCPRGNTAGLIIMALRTLSQETGLFVESEKGRQQFVIKRVIGQNIIDIGYCIHPRRVNPELHMEQGPIWKWIVENDESIYNKLGGGNYGKEGPGVFRKISEESMNEIRNIFKVTGGNDFMDKIEDYSRRKAKELGFDFDKEGDDQRYFMHVYQSNSQTHNKDTEG